MAPTNLNSLEQLDFYAIDNHNAFLDENDLSRDTPLNVNPEAELALNRPKSRNMPPIEQNEDYSNNATTICVFCGASPGNNPKYMEAARDLARIFARENIKLVYGGGTVGLMGELARALVKLSGPESVHGIIPAPLVKYEQGPDSQGESNNAGEHGVPDPSIYGQTTVVEDMHTRKQMMAQQVMRGGPGSGFIALPGGYGTLEELMEVVTWNQLGIHGKGIVVLNTEGYWDGLLQWVNNSIESGFVREGNRGIFVSAQSSEDAVKALKEYKTPEGRFKLEWGTL